MKKYSIQDEERFLQRLHELVNHSIRSIGRLLSSYRFKDLAEWINYKTPKLLDTTFQYSWSTKIHWIFNDIVDFPICLNENCNNVIGHHINIKINRGYHKYCSIKCVATSKCIIDKRTSSLNKHIKTDPNFLQSIQLKKQNTINNHIKENPNYWKDIENKKKETKIKNGHAPNWTNSEKAKKTLAQNPDSLKLKYDKMRNTKQLKAKENQHYYDNISNGLKLAYQLSGDAILEKRKNTIALCCEIDEHYLDNISNRISLALIDAWELSSNNILAKRINTQKLLAKNDPDYFEKISQHKSDAITLSWKLNHDNIIEKRNTTISLHLKENPNYWSDIDLKRKWTNFDLHGNPNYNNIELILQTNIDTYGVSCVWQAEEIKEKCRLIHLKNYGVDNVFLADEIKKKCNTPNAQQKIQETKRHNGTFNTSKPEEKSYELLCSHFSKEDVIRQYRSDVYPFNCDFYIKSIDTYIECNFSWTHGEHWFDESNEEDLKKLQKWKDKGTKFYLVAIDVWTKRDVSKLKTAKENNLKYIVFWKLDEVESWLALLKNNKLK